MCGVPKRPCVGQHKRFRGETSGLWSLDPVSDRTSTGTRWAGTVGRAGGWRRRVTKGLPVEILSLSASWWPCPESPSSTTLWCPDVLPHSRLFSCKPSRLVSPVSFWWTPHIQHIALVNFWKLHFLGFCPFFISMYPTVIVYLVSETWNVCGL